MARGSLVRIPMDCRGTAAVVHQYRYVAGDHIVRMDVCDGEVVHEFGTGEVVRTNEIERLSLRPGKTVSGNQISSWHPLVRGRIPERMVRGRVQDERMSSDRAPSNQHGL